MTLRGITERQGTVRIGALTTYTEIHRSAIIRRRLADARGGRARNRRRADSESRHARRQRGERVARGRHAAGAGRCRGQRGAGQRCRQRRVPFSSFYTGYRKTVARPDELIVALHIAPIRGRQWFRKVGTRAAQAISKVVIAGVDGPSPRIALGSVAPTVVRLTRTEQALATGSTIEAAQQILQGEIAPIDDIRSTADYRRRVAANLLAEFWQQTKAGKPRRAR